MKMETAVRYHSTLTRMAIMKKKKRGGGGEQTRIGKDVEKFPHC